MPEQENTSATAKKQEEEVRLKQEQEEKERLSAKEQSEKLSEISDSITQKYTEHQFQNPVLASQADKLTLKIAKLEDKNVALQGKIETNNNKVNKWQAKIKDRTAAKAYYKELLDTTALPKPLQSFIQSRYDRQDDKIKALSEKINVKREKNKSLDSKIGKNNQKIAKHQQKLKRLEKTDTFLTNLTTKEGRRENFVEGLQELRQWALDRNTVKAVKIAGKIANKELAITKTRSAAEKVKLRNQIQKLKNKQETIENKIAKLTDMTEKLTKIKLLPSEQQEQISTAAYEKVNQAIEQNKNKNPDKINETIIEAANEAVSEGIEQFYDYAINGKIHAEMKEAVSNSNGKDKMQYLYVSKEQAEFLKSAKESRGLEFAIFDSKPNTNGKEKLSDYQISYRASNENKIKQALADFEKQAEKENPLKNTETAIEENYNNIDGVNFKVPELFDKAVRLAAEKGMITESDLQRNLRIGYKAAVELMDTMEKMGVVAPQQGSNARKFIQSSETKHETSEKKVSAVFGRKAMKARAEKTGEKPKPTQEKQQPTKKDPSL